MTTDKAIVVIPARGGSKRIPGKNLKNLGGKSLIQYTIEAARQVFREDQIFISTDSTEIRDAVRNLGLEVPFLRPAYLATDEAGSYEVLLHALEFVEQRGLHPEVLILLQPTSPFRTAEHIAEALKLYTPSVDMVVSVKETKANPYFILKEENEKGFLVPSKEGNFSSKQDSPKIWEYNGAIYVINVESLKSASLKNFKKVKKYQMDEISSHDIDTPLDWLTAEVIHKNIFQ